MSPFIALVGLDRVGADRAKHMLTNVDLGSLAALWAAAGNTDSADELAVESNGQSASEVRKHPVYCLNELADEIIRNVARWLVHGRRRRRLAPAQQFGVRRRFVGLRKGAELKRWVNNRDRDIDLSAPPFGQRLLNSP